MGIKNPGPVDVHMPVVAGPPIKPFNCTESLFPQTVTSVPALTIGDALMNTMAVSVSVRQPVALVEDRIKTRLSNIESAGLKS